LGCRDCLLRRLLDLPRIGADSVSDSGQQQVQRLFKRVAAMFLRKEQELPELSIVLVGCPLPVKAFPAIAFDKLSSKYHSKSRSLVNARQGEWRFCVE